jgi:hypothetical protein
LFDEISDCYPEEVQTQMSRLSLTAEEQEILGQIMADMKSTDEDRKANAFAALRLPVNAKADENSYARMIMNVERITSGEAKYPVVDGSDIEVLVVPSLNTPPQNLRVSGLLTVPTEDMVSSFEFPESFVEDSRIDMMAYAMSDLANAFIKKENAIVKTLLEDYIGSAQVVTDPVNANTGFSYELFLRMFQYFDENPQHTPKLCLCSANAMREFRTWATDSFDDITKREIFTDTRQSVLGVEIVVWDELSDSYAYMIDTDCWGVMPITKELETREDPKARSEFSYKINARQRLGFAVLDKSAVCRGTFN